MSMTKTIRRRKEKLGRKTLHKECVPLATGHPYYQDSIHQQHRSHRHKCRAKYEQI
jgi:hypothetical protein